MKTKEELSALKAEVETLNKKLRELTEDELAQVTGGLTELFGSPKQGNDHPYSEYFTNQNSQEPKDIHIYKNNIKKDFDPNIR